MPPTDPQATSPLVYVNDHPRPLGANRSLFALLTELALADRAGVAVALNDAVVPKAGWNERTLQNGDRVLVIQASQGG
jgi:sulfur carrier protein